MKKISKLMIISLCHDFVAIGFYILGIAYGNLLFSLIGMLLTMFGIMWFAFARIVR